jgi:peptidoglycan hydrolase-like protein with peptidoglycan-binding domain
LGFGTLALTVLAFLAGRVSLAPVEMPQKLPPSEVLATVGVREVGKALTFNVTVAQPRNALAVNQLVGVVTKVAGSGDKRVGDVLYSVADVPVRAVKGSMPFYRELGLGVQGEDVRQLRSALVSLKLLGAKGDKFDRATQRAVKTWQKKLGIPATGVVTLGELVAVPTLPGAVIVDGEAARLGAALAGGEQIVFAASGDPVFTLVLSPAQAELIPESATVGISFEGKDWDARIVDSQTSEGGSQVRLTLASADGGPVCGADCSLVSGENELYLLSQVQVVPPASGPSVPVSALTSNPDGSVTVTVIGTDGTRSERPVTVLGSQDGVAVVEGVRDGETVQVLAGPASPSVSATP